MTDLTDDKTQKIFRTIVRDEVTAIIKSETRTIVREEAIRVAQQETRAVVREETSDMRQTLDLLAQVQGSQSIMLRTLMTDITQIKETVRAQGVFYEDLEDRFTVLAENVGKNLTLRQQVSDHETRLLHLEAASHLPKLAQRATRSRKPRG